ncbi:hypothetical protein COOONC_28373 [Cooperia oncophora]
MPCIIHFLQAAQSSQDPKEIGTAEESKRVDDQLSEAALRLVEPTYTVILNMFKSPHIANPNLLHRAELRSGCFDQVECPELSPFTLLSASLDPAQFPLEDGDPSPLQLDAGLEVPPGELPWLDLLPSELASLELLLSFVEHLAGALVTAPSCLQSPLLFSIQKLINSIKDGGSATLTPIRLLISLYVCNSTEESGDLGTVMVDGIEGLPLKERMLAQQVFLVDSQQQKHQNGISGDEPESDLDLVVTVDGEKQRISVSFLISTLLAHQLIVQMIGSILCPCERPPKGLEKILSGGDCAGRSSLDIPDDVRIMLHHSLDASFQVALDFDCRPSLSVFSGKCALLRPNLTKQLAHRSLSKMHVVPIDLHRLCNCHIRMVALLREVEIRNAEKRIAAAAREYKEEKFEFMLVESDGEKLYKIYKKQLPMGLPSKPIGERPNPFKNGIMEERKDESEPDHDTLQLLAYRQICLVPIETILSMENAARLLPQVIDSVKKLILATPDITIRHLAVQIIEMTMS